MAKMNGLGHGLGKGLGALLGDEAVEKAPQTAAAVDQIDLNLIDVNH